MPERPSRERFPRSAAVAIGILALLLPGLAAALSAPPALDALEETDRQALERIARQPEALRDAALLASRHVDVLVETQRIQEQSSAAFQARIDGLERARQEQVWEIVREPGLLDELAGAAPRGAEALEAAVARHPDVPAEAIREIGARYAPLLAEVQRIQRRADERFEALLADLPDAAARDAFRDLLAEPELLSLLARRVQLVVRLGDSFADDPEATRAHLAALGAEVAAEEARAREAWVASIADDPEAAGELEASARAYAEENGLDYDALTEPEVRTRVTVVVHPYPYWFGYPAWYVDYHLFPYGYWYPYPLHFGFHHHHHHHRRTVWYGYPSPHFMFWFFGGHHHHHYTHLAHGFDHHYRRHRRAHSPFHATLSSWTHWRDRDHRHGRRHYDGGRQRSGGDGVFVSLFENARFESGGDRHRSRDESRPRARDSRRGERAPDVWLRRDRERDPHRDRARDRHRDRDGRHAAPNPERGDRVDRDRRRDIPERGQRAVPGPRSGRGDEAADRDRRRDIPERGQRAVPGPRSRGGEDRAERGRDRRGDPRMGRPEPRPERPRVRVRDHRRDAVPDHGRSRGSDRDVHRSSSSRERGFSPRDRDRSPAFSSRERGAGPRFDRGSRGGGRHEGRHDRGDRGRGRR